MANLFKTAPVVQAPEKVKKSKAIEVNLEGLQDYAELDSLIKNLTTMQKTLGGELHDKMYSIFKAGKTRPENFTGIDGIASASCQMKTRSSASPLTPEERQALDADEIPYDKEEVVPQRFIVNPRYMGDEALLEKISKAISKVPGLPEDFIQMQASSEKFVVTDATIDAIYEKKLTDKFLKMTTTPAIRPTLSDTNIMRAMKRVTELLVPSKKKIA